MLRYLSYQFGIIAFAGLIALTTSGLSIDLHLCEGSIHSVSLLGKARSCHDIQVEASCHSNKTKGCCSKDRRESIANKCTSGCCQSETVVLNLDEDYVVWSERSDDSVEIWKRSISTESDSKSLGLWYLMPTQYLNFKPPLLGGDLTIRHQVFRL